MPKLCEVCGKKEEHAEEKHDTYGVCQDCMDDRYIEIPE
jgi:NMD protein affecting ribosome stability and mRNA decay